MLQRRNSKKYAHANIAPEDIFLDSTNLPDFDRSQFEGRMERPISRVSHLVLAGFFLCVGIIYLYVLGELQIQKGEEYAVLSENNRLQHSLLFSDRGLIYDRNSIELAWNVPNTEDEFARRMYTATSGLSHLLGYVRYPAKDIYGFYYKTEYTGAEGVEFEYNDVLSGKNGLQIIETNAKGTPISSNTIRLPEQGESVTLTVDSRVQQKMYEIMKRLSNERGFTGGASGIMDVRTGELLTFLSFPEFSSEVMSNATDTEKIRSYQNDDTGTPFLNRMISGLYTPGSIVKPFIALAALAEDVISPQKTIVSTGRLVVPNPYDPDNPSIFTDWKAHGSVNMQQAIAVSSNIYFYQVGGGYESQDGLGIERIKEYMNKFGFGKPYDFLSQYSPGGVVPDPEWKEKTFTDGVWRLGDTYFTSIGQYGFQVTPLQVLRGFAAIANKGTLPTPTLVSATGNEVKERVDISDIYFDVVREGMRQGVLYGTVTGVNVPYVSIAAKTGTAELGSKKQFVNSWVAGFFPYEEPRYSFVVLMERGPRSNLIGATAAARELFDWMSIHTPEYFAVN